MPAAASAKRAHHHKHCKHGYVLTHKQVKRHRHGKTVRKRVEVCVKRKHHHKHHKPATVTKPTATALAPAPVIKLHAHLDPTFARDPSNPFKVTYAYSASATTETVGLALSQTSTTLPEGVLTLYNDGLLACSINVGGSTTGGECPVTYSTLGAHTVTTIYQSGSTSATETASEMIEPFSTTTSGTVSYEALAAPVKIGGENEGSCFKNCYQVGTLVVNATTASPYGTLSQAPRILSCNGAADCIEGVTVSIEQAEETQPPYAQYVRAVYFGSTRPEAASEFVPSVTESGLLYMQVASPKLNGYLESSVRLMVTFPTPSTVE